MVVWLAAGLFTAVFTAFTWYVYEHYLNLSYDLGLYCQALHRFAHGSTYVSISLTRFLGVHAHYLHFLLTPLAWISAPHGLLLLQSAAIALAAPALYRFAARRLKPRNALLVALAYLLSPLVHAPALFDFHPEVLGMAFLAWALVCLDEEKFAGWLVMIFLLALTKESCGLVLMLLGAVALLWKKPGRYWYWSIGLGAITLFGGMAVVRAFNDNGLDSLRSFYPGLTADPFGYLGDVLFAPGWARMETLLLLFAGVLFLPFLRPRLLLAAVPVILLPLIAQLPNLQRPVFHYYALALVLLYFGAAEGLKGRRERILAPLLLLAALGLHFYHTPVAEVRRFAEGPSLKIYRITPPFVSPVAELPLFQGRTPRWPGVDVRGFVRRRREETDAMLARLPAGAGVAAPPELLAHLASREHLYLTGLVVPDDPEEYDFSAFPHRDRLTRLVIDRPRGLNTREALTEYVRLRLGFPSPLPPGVEIDWVTSRYILLALPGRPR